MPNHVHVLFQPLAPWSLQEIVGSWKKHSARRIRDLHPGYPLPVWHREFWDRYIRDESHLQDAIRYNEHNPVKAALCSTPQSWPWSSAFPGNANLPIGASEP